MNALLSLILSDPLLPAEFRDGVRIASHKLSAEARQELDDDHFDEMRQEAREREQMEDEDEL
jgi:hypothetical protein